MTIETEQQGGGMIQNLPCSRIRAVMGANPFAWVGENARGLLGMDNMDLAGLNVDPQKNAARNAARLARRV